MCVVDSTQHIEHEEFLKSYPCDFKTLRNKEMHDFIAMRKLEQLFAVAVDVT